MVHQRIFHSAYLNRGGRRGGDGRPEGQDQNGQEGGCLLHPKRLSRRDLGVNLGGDENPQLSISSIPDENLVPRRCSTPP